MASGIAFDVNETLLDLSALDPLFDGAFMRPGARREWFALMKEIWLVNLALERHEDLSAVARGALSASASSP